MRELLETARSAAEAAAAVHREWAPAAARAGAAEKGDSDFVTRVDLDSQRAAIERIRARFPHHPVLAEEEDGETHGPGRETPPDPGLPLWIVDPLDGTTNFLHGHPAYAASVGVVLGGRVVAGVIVAAATHERWWALDGEGAYRNGSRIRVSETASLRSSLVGTGFPFKRLGELEEYLGQFARVLRATSGIRRCGSAALDLAYLAQGSLDAFWEGRLSAWDVAGGLALLAEAGGTQARLDGEALLPWEDGSVLAANGPALLYALGAVVRGER